jgi:DNA modification methylase
MEIETKIILGDCCKELKELGDNTIDLIFTSPPYADQRKNTYGGVPLISTSNGFCLYRKNYIVC